MSKTEKTPIKQEIKMAYKGIQNLPITLKKGKIEQIEKVKRCLKF